MRFAIWNKVDEKKRNALNEKLIQGKKNLAGKIYASSLC